MQDVLLNASISAEGGELDKYVGHPSKLWKLPIDAVAISIQFADAARFDDGVFGLAGRESA